DTFPFRLGSGFAGFDTPDTFIQFNRALKARASLYAGTFQDALDALAESFITTAPGDLQLDLGVFHVYGTGPGDSLNGLSGGIIFAHPSLRANAEKDAAMAVIDQRVLTKLTPIGQETSGSPPRQYSSSDRF